MATSSDPLVFIVDNEELIVRALHRVLVRAGYRTACLASAQAARERVADELPVAVITDLNMPLEHGLSLLSDLRQRHPGLATVLLTGGELTPEMILMARRFADAVVSKPCEPMQLVERLGQLLSERGDAA
ncbi:MAG: response regulator [Kofleriaceae bacterium]